MTAQLDAIIDLFKEHIKALHDGRDEATGQIILSRQMIVRSYALLRLGDKIEAEQSNRQSNREVICRVCSQAESREPVKPWPATIAAS